jgi:hypothetical protein
MGYYSLIKKSTITLIALFTVALSANAQSYNGRWDRNQDDRYDRNDRYNDRTDGRYNNYQSGWTKERTRTFAEMFGYRLAFNEFQDAMNRGYSPREFRNESSYRNDTTGWFNWMGFREDYRNGFRRGYENGFRDVTNYRHARYSRPEIERVLGARMKDVYPREKYYDDDDYNDGGYGNGGYNNGGYNNGGYGNGGYNGGYGNGGYNNGSRYSRDEVIRIASQNAQQDGYRHGQDDARRNRQYNFQDSDGFQRATNGYRTEFGNLEIYKQAYREGYRRAYDEGFRSIRRW